MEERLEETDKEYALILESNDMNERIQEEIGLLHKELIEVYESKFPELKQLVENPLSYARVVKRIDNEIDITNVDFGDAVKRSPKIV